MAELTGDNRKMLKVKLDTGLIHGQARMPTRAHDGDAGYDLYVSETTHVPPHSFRDVPSGVYVELPSDCWGLLTGRSSTIRNRGLLVIQGVIDPGYRGEMFSAVWNLTDDFVTLDEGDRIAQLIVIPNETARTRLCQVDVLSDTPRGTSGFGSSGV